ncbi:MAG: TolC family protein [Bacteroides sp.]|nr:TolC family protein [Bacteroides sp.]MCM1421786.1 TolC family protein [Bacteroides sp.]
MYVFALLCWELACTATLSAQRRLTLDEAIMLARKQSVEAEVALGELKSAYWEYRTYRANLLPEISLGADIPSYNKRYSSYQREDGSYSFVRNDNVGIDGNLSLTQNLWFTGGSLSLQSSLDFTRNIGHGNDKQYMSVPLALTLSQPIFAANTFKWNRRIEPLRYKEAKASFLSSTEDVALSAITYFFNLLLAKENVGISRQNLRNAEKLYEVAQAKRRMGQISENDVLQLRLNMLNAQSALTENESSLRSAMFALRSFLALGEDEEVEPVVPDSVPTVVMNYESVLSKALENNSFAHSIRRRQLEADYAVARAKGNLRQMTLFAQVGYTGTDRSFNGAYSTLKDNQVVEVGMRIPILDWGKRKGQVKVAQSNRRVTESRLRQETMNFNQNLFILTEQFNNQLRQLRIAEEADVIACKRYETNVETFMIGKISTLDLNDAQTAKDEARRKRVSELYSYWRYFYQLRSLTLWDFVADTGIDADFSEIVKN